MEQAIDFTANAEFVDVTALGLRLRKKTLAANRRRGTRRCPSLGGTLSRQSRLKLFVSSGLAVSERQAVRSIAGLPVRLRVDGMANRGRVLLDSLKVRAITRTQSPDYRHEPPTWSFFQGRRPVAFCDLLEGIHGHDLDG